MKIASLKAKKCFSIGFVGAGFFICETEIQKLFCLPDNAAVLTFEIHDRLAQDRLAFCIRPKTTDMGIHYIQLYTLERKRAMPMDSTNSQTRWLSRRLRLSEAYYAELWYEVE